MIAAGYGKKKMKPQPKARALFTQYFAKADGNAKKMETNSMKRAVRVGTADAEREKAKAKNVKKAMAEFAASYIHDELTCPLVVGRDEQQINLLLEGMMAAVQVRSLIEEEPLSMVARR